MHNKTASWAVAAVLFFCLLNSGCGRKAWPRASVPENRIGLTDLSASWDNGKAVVEARTLRPEEQEDTALLVKGMRLYHASFPPDFSLCEGCPIEYRDVWELEAVEEEGKIKVFVRGLRKDSIHFFQARVLCVDGSVGPLSARIKLTGERE